MKMEEVFRKLKPVIGKKADQLWVEWLIGDQVVKQMIELDLRLTLAGLFGAGFDQKQILLEPPPRERALGEYCLGPIYYGEQKFYRFGLREKEWIQHVGVFGRSGSGKTNVGFLILLNWIYKDNYLRKIRPAQGRIYQEVEHAPGAAMQVDWGSCGGITIGETRRKLSVFVAVLCFSRLIFIEFTLNQSKELFYRSIVKALQFFQFSPQKIIVDNLKAAVAKGYGRNAVFHPEFASLCGYYRMQPIACDRYDPESKGIVEGGVRYVKRNALAGRADELPTFQDYQRLAVYWRDEIANLRKHDTTGNRPVDRFEKERDELRPLPVIPYDTDEIRSVVVTPHARVRFEANRYSVAPDYVRKPVLIRADDKRVRVFHFESEIACHARCYEKKLIIVDPQHRQAALARRKRSQSRLVEANFDALGPAAETFRSGLNHSPAKPIVHIRRILALVKLYGKTEVLAALSRATEYQTFDAAYVQNLIDQERRRRHAPSPIPLRPYTNPSLLLLDELGYLPVDKRGADLLFQVIATRYEAGSVVITTNRAFKDWGAILDVDNTLATALIDRLMHHGDAIVIKGPSYRMKDRDDDLGETK